MNQETYRISPKVLFTQYLIQCTVTKWLMACKWSGAIITSDLMINTDQNQNLLACSCPNKLPITFVTCTYDLSTIIHSILHSDRLHTWHVYTTDGVYIFCTTHWLSRFSCPEPASWACVLSLRPDWVWQGLTEAALLCIALPRSIVALSTLSWSDFSNCIGAFIICFIICLVICFVICFHHCLGAMMQW